MDAQTTSCPAPKRSGRITIRRRRAAPPAPVRQSARDERAVVNDLPQTMPVLREEVAILRAYLDKEIDAILFGEE